MPFYRRPPRRRRPPSLPDSFARRAPIPTKIKVCCFWLLEIPLAYLLAIKMHVGETGVFYAIIIAETAMTLCALAVFKRGRWKQKKV